MEKSEGREVTLREPRAGMKIGVYLRAAFSQYQPLWGPVAQLIERVVRNDEVDGLIPFRSTNFSRASPEPFRAGAVKAGRKLEKKSVPMPG